MCGDSLLKKKHTEGRRRTRVTQCLRVIDPETLPECRRGAMSVAPVRALAPLLPPFALGAGLACVAGAAALANCALLSALLGRTMNGIFYILHVNCYYLLRS